MKKFNTTFNFPFSTFNSNPILPKRRRIERKDKSCLPKNYNYTNAKSAEILCKLF